MKAGNVFSTLNSIHRTTEILFTVIACNFDARTVAYLEV